MQGFAALDSRKDEDQQLRNLILTMCDEPVTIITLTIQTKSCLRAESYMQEDIHDRAAGWG